MVSFIRGFLTGLDYLVDPNNAADAAAILANNSRDLSADAAAGQIKGLLGKTGFSDKAAIDLDGVRKVLELRSKYGEPRKELPDPMKYIDLSYYEEALASL